MKKRIAVISIVVENPDSVEILNNILFSYREYIIGRMGIPYRERGVNIICVVIEASENDINTLAGKIGKLDKVSTKINFSNVITDI